MPPIFVATLSFGNTSWQLYSLEYGFCADRRAILLIVNIKKILYNIKKDI